MRIKKLLSLLIFISFSSIALAQPYSCNTDDQGKFYVMDGETVHEIEYLAPLSFKVGANCIAYVDNTQNFKVYYKGESKQLAEGYTTSYYVSTDLVVIGAGSYVYAFDDGKVKLLSPYCSRFFAGDSIIAFNDSQKYVFNYYWKGKIEKLEDILGSNPITNIVVGKNIIAYNNIYNNFRIVYQGEIIDQESQPAPRFKAGANIVAYTDATGSFKIFYKGETTEIGGFPPKRFLIGDNIVAYIDINGGFKIFYDGNTTDMGTYTPTYFNVVDNMVVYADAAGGLSVFYKGNTTRLENYIPQGIQVSPNSITYIDNSNRVQFFTYGKSVEVGNDNIDNVHLTYDVLKIKTGFNSHKYYWKDKIVESN